jgi:hypothetical protein
MSDKDFEFDIDLSSFEGRQKARYEEASAEPDVADEIAADQPWADEASYEDLYSVESIWKARLLNEGGYVEKVSDALYTVAGSQQYAVHILEGGADQPVPWATCSCPNGQARGGRPSCYHTAAVLAKILDKDLSSYEKPPKARR